MQFQSEQKLKLFETNPERHAPLAHRLRPQNLEAFIGQAHLLGEGAFLDKIIKGNTLPSLILWGPPGSGKTSLALLIAKKKDVYFKALSATTSGIKEIKQIVSVAEERLELFSKKTLLFIDEIHRFNKAQQDGLLPHIEQGTLTLIGATTENPSFEVISPLLSRCKVVTLKALEKNDLKIIAERALTHFEHGLGSHGLQIEANAMDFLCESCDGDARRLLNTLEIVFDIVGAPAVPLPIQLPHIELALQKKHLLYDKAGEEHYNIISAFIKSMRDSDPDAAVYYLARMLEAGEDPLFVARRMVIFASEDIGNANPQALSVAMACMQSFHFVGMPEGWIPLAQSTTYLASSPKSNASYLAYLKAKEDVKKHGALPVPFHLRNAPTKLMKKMGYGKNYQYAHDEKDHIVIQEHLPDGLKGKKYYAPTDIGYEERIREWMKKVEEKNGSRK